MGALLPTHLCCVAVHCVGEAELHAVVGLLLVQLMLLFLSLCCHLHTKPKVSSLRESAIGQREQVHL